MICTLTRRTSKDGADRAGHNVLQGLRTQLTEGGGTIQGRGRRQKRRIQI